MSTVLIASQNPHKIKMISWIFESLDVKIRTISHQDKKSLEVFNEFEDTLQKIAENKAEFLSKKYPGYIVVATDAGMDIPVLEEKWDKRFTRRFAGAEATDEKRISTLLELMEHKEDRTATWHEAIALAENGENIFSVEVTGARGEIQTTFSPVHYREGIWLCSLWYFPQFKKNFFEMTPKEVEYAEISWFKLKAAVESYFKSRK